MRMSGGHARAIEERLPDLYRFASTPTVELLRAYTNDVYAVADGASRYALKIYALGWRHDSEILYETELLRHLAGNGIAVAQAIPALDGALLTHAELGGEHRQLVLFEFAEGAKPTPPFTLDMYHREGQATAALHAAADDFVSPHHRRPFDLERLIDEPASEIRPGEASPEAGRFLATFGRQLRAAIEAFAAQGLDWGPCHGDLTFDNFHLTADGRTVWYDFDSGGPCWRAVDVQGWVATDPAMQERQDAFIAGYRTVRAIDDRDVAASRFLAAAQEYWGIGIDLPYRVRARGREAVRAYLDERAETLEQWRRVLGL